MSKQALIKSSGVIGAATALSRVMGFVRDIIIATYFGTGPAAQAFVVAFRIPNTLRDIVGEGAMNSGIVPVLTDIKTLKGENEFVRVSKVLLNLSLLILSVLAILGVVFSPVIVRAIAPGFLEDPDKFNLTVRLTRIMFPYLVLIGLTAYSMGVLNTLRNFSSSAFGPSIMNTAIIIASLWLARSIGIMSLAIGVLVGGALQLGINIPFMYKRGITLDVRSGFDHAAVRRIGKLLVPRAIGSAVYQLNIFVDTILASISSIVGEGGVAALYYANRLIQFPLAIFGLAIAQAALPKMSEEYALKDTARFKETISFGLRVVFLIMLPAGFGLAILGKPIIKILFERGEFASYSTAITENALLYYSFGLFAYSGVKILSSAFFAMHDTRTPVKTAAAALLINVILNIILMWPLKLGGLALATSISATFNFIALFMILKKRIGDFGVEAILTSVSRALGASIVMSLALVALANRFPCDGAFSLVVSISFASLVYIAAAYLFKVKEIMDFAAWITKKR